MGDVQQAEMSREKQRYYRLHGLVVYALLLAFLSLVTRPTAWGGCSLVIVCMAAFFLYHFLTRAQLGLLEFTLTMAVLGHSLALTLKYVWPVFQGSEVDWFILPVVLSVAVWVLGGALWSGWVVRTLELNSTWQRLQVLIVGWLMPVAFPGLIASFFLTITGVPTYILQYIGLRGVHLQYSLYEWWVLLMPLTAYVCYKVVAEGLAINAAARDMRTDQELVEHAAKFGAPEDPIAPDPRAAL